MKLMHGDCLDLLATLEPGSIDMVLADPPYGTTRCKWDSIIPLGPLWWLLKRVIKPNGAIVMMAGQPFTSALIMSNLPLFKYCWVWDKKIGGNFAAASKMPLKVTEDIVVFGGGAYYPQKTKGKMRKKGGGRQFVGIYGGKNYDKTTEPYFSDEYHPVNLITISNAARKGKVHPTQKPVALMEYMIKTYIDPGETVLDFSMGSGTTGVAAVRTGRKFIGIELDEKYFNTARDRINLEIIGAS